MKAKKTAIRARDEVFVLRTSTLKGKRTWWGSVQARAPILGRAVMTTLLALHTAYRAKTYWAVLVAEYQVSSTLAAEPFYYLGMCVAALVSLCLYVVTEGEAVRDADAEELPDEALLWEWCVPCGVLRPPDASHCSWCRRCIRHRYYHRLTEYKCVSSSNVRSFLCYLLTDLLSGQTKLSTAHIKGSVLFLFDFFGLFWFLGYYCYTQAFTPKETNNPEEIFRISRSSKRYSSKKQPMFSFSTQKGAVCTELCPTGERNGECPSSKPRIMTRCPKPRCNTISKRFWMTGDEDDIAASNICQSVFTVPDDDMRQTEATAPDTEWLLTKGTQKVVLVFMLDTPAAGQCRAVIDRWVWEEQPPMDVDVDVVTPAEGHARRYRQDRFTHERYADEVTGHMNLDTVLTMVSQDLSCRGGRLVFVRESSSPLARTTLVALGRAARSVPLEYVSLARVRGASLPPDLYPGLLQQIQRGGGTFRQLSSPVSLAKFLRRRELVPRGVHESLDVGHRHARHVRGVQFGSQSESPLQGRGHTVEGRDGERFHALVPGGEGRRRNGER